MALELAPRQRAMLQEMGVTVWWPQAPAVAAPAAVPLLRARPAALPTPPEIPAPKPDAPPLRPAAEGAATRAAHIAQMDWPALQAAVQGCRDCALGSQRQHAVFGSGAQPPDALAADAAMTTAGPSPVDWLVVGEAPDAAEDAQGQAAVGPPGTLLDNLLRAVRLPGSSQPLGRQHRTFITPVVKCRPPGDRPPLPDEISACQPYLARQIALLQPRLILALGRVAALPLLIDSGPQVQALPLGQMRGKAYRFRGVPVVVSYAPAHLLRHPQDKAKAWADACLAMQHSNDAGPGPASTPATAV
ncbi:MAG: uracil-DNA glycosylase [Burkholderiaceae bacterium]